MTLVNTSDHESEGERIALSKPIEGSVTLDIARQGRRIVFSCTDDGAGVDLDAVRRAAQRKGWLAPATQGLDAPALLPCESAHRGGARIAVFLRPALPAAAEFLAQRFEQRVGAHAARGALAEFLQLLPAFICICSFKNQRQDFELRRAHAVVVHQLRLAQRAQPLLEPARAHETPRGGAARVLGNCLDIEIERVERVAARWAVRAHPGGRMQRVDADQGRPEAGPTAPQIDGALSTTRSAGMFQYQIIRLSARGVRIGWMVSSDGAKSAS